MTFPQVEYRNVSVSTRALVGSAAVPTVGGAFINLARVGVGVFLSLSWSNKSIDSLDKRNIRGQLWLLGKDAEGSWLVVFQQHRYHTHSPDCHLFPHSLPPIQSLLFLKPKTQELKILTNISGVLKPVGMYI